MKNPLFIFCFTFLALFSCSSDNDSDGNNSDNDTILLRKIVSSDGTFQEFFYTGNKLDRIIFDDGNYDEYTYSGNYITSIQEFNSNGQSTGNWDIIEYVNGKISRVETYSNNELVEVRNISYNDSQIITFGDQNEDTNYWLSSIDVNDNVFKVEKYENSQVFGTDILTYDNKNNPFKNVQGFGLFGLYESYNNNILTENANYDLPVGNYTNNITRSYEYNEQNYPVSSTIVNSNDNSNVLLTFYY